MYSPLAPQEEKDVPRTMGLSLADMQEAPECVARVAVSEGSPGKLELWEDHKRVSANLPSRFFPREDELPGMPVLEGGVVEHLEAEAGRSFCLRDPEP